MTSKREEAIELLPCPFCGNKAQTYGTPREPEESAEFGIECTYCDVYGFYASSEEKAGEKWNRRAASIDREQIVIPPAESVDCEEREGFCNVNGLLIHGSVMRWLDAMDNNQLELLRASIKEAWIDDRPSPPVAGPKCGRCERLQAEIDKLVVVIETSYCETCADRDGIFKHLPATTAESESLEDRARAKAFLSKATYQSLFERARVHWQNSEVKPTPFHMTEFAQAEIARQTPAIEAKAVEAAFAEVEKELTDEWYGEGIEAALRAMQTVKARRSAQGGEE